MLHPGEESAALGEILPLSVGDLVGSDVQQPLEAARLVEREDSAGARMGIQIVGELGFLAGGLECKGQRALPGR